MVAVDGNFKLENVATCKPENDVSLSDGEAFQVGTDRYQRHLKLTPEPKKVSLLYGQDFLLTIGRSPIIIILFTSADTGMHYYYYYYYLTFIGSARNRLAVIIKL